MTSRWKLLLLAGVPALLIGSYFYLKAPVTLTTVLYIAFNVATIVAAFLLEIIEGMTKVIGGLVELQARHVQVTEKVVSALQPEGGRPSSGA